MGIVLCRESPWGWAPTIHFGMAVDAINVSEITYATPVPYYLANLGTTMESQVRSSVALCRTPVTPLYRLGFPFNLSQVLSPFPCASLCAALPSLSLWISLRDSQGLYNLVAARLSRTPILAVTARDRRRAGEEDCRPRASMVYDCQHRIVWPVRW